VAVVAVRVVVVGSTAAWGRGGGEDEVTELVTIAAMTAVSRPMARSGR
jgi:hypothetical protein